jgi:hypothetical protein
MTSTRQVIRKIQPGPLADFDDHQWPSNCALLVLAGFSVGAVIAGSDFDDVRLLYNGWTRLAGLALTAGVLLWGMIRLRGAVQRRLQLAVLLSLALHMALGLYLHQTNVRLAVESPLVDAGLFEESEPVTLPDYNFNSPQETPPVQEFERPVATDTPDAAAEPMEREPPDLADFAVERRDADAASSTSQPNMADLERTQVAAPRRAADPGGLERSRQDVGEFEPPREEIPQVLPEAAAPAEIDAAQDLARRTSTSPEVERLMAEQSDAPSVDLSLAGPARDPAQPDLNPADVAAEIPERQSPDAGLPTRVDDAAEIARTGSPEPSPLADSDLASVSQRASVLPPAPSSTSIDAADSAPSVSSESPSRARNDGRDSALDSQAPAAELARASRPDSLPGAAETGAVHVPSAGSSSATGPAESDLARVGSRSTRPSPVGSAASVGESVEASLPGSVAAAGPRMRSRTTQGAGSVPEDAGTVARSEIGGGIPTTAYAAEAAPVGDVAGSPSPADVDVSAGAGVNRLASRPGTSVGGLASPDSRADQGTGLAAGEGPTRSRDAEHVASTGAPAAGPIGRSASPSAPIDSRADAGGEAGPSSPVQSSGAAGAGPASPIRESSGSAVARSRTGVPAQGGPRSEQSTEGSPTVASREGPSRADGRQGQEETGPVPIGGPVQRSAPAAIPTELASSEDPGPAPGGSSAAPPAGSLETGPAAEGPRRRTDTLTVNIPAPEGDGGVTDNPAQSPGLPIRRARPESDVVHTLPERFVMERSGSRPVVDAQTGEDPAAIYRARDPKAREEAAQSQGGSQGSELAVEIGLDFLARIQSADGHWSIDAFSAGRADMAGADEGTMQSNTAGTGLALLAFLGAGYTHKDGKHRLTVERGLNYLLAHQRENGDLFVPGAKYCWLYSHGIASIALCEAYGMTRDAEIRDPAQKAIDFIVSAQHPDGGWRYSPRRDAQLEAQWGQWSSDTSVSGWQLMALKSGELSGLDVPSHVLEGVGRWLDVAQGSGYGSLYTYNPRSLQRHQAEPSPAMTAEGLLMRLYLGWQREDPRMAGGVKYLSENPPRFGTAERSQRDTYYWYYATQVMFQTQGKPWQDWNAQLRDMLVASQLQDGPLAGSWDPLTPTPDRWGEAGGRLYVTAMHLLQLEVYYRHLPLFQTLVPATAEAAGAAEPTAGRD